MHHRSGTLSAGISEACSPPCKRAASDSTRPQVAACKGKRGKHQAYPDFLWPSNSSQTSTPWTRAAKCVLHILRAHAAHPRDQGGHGHVPDALEQVPPRPFFYDCKEDYGPPTTPKKQGEPDTRVQTLENTEPRSRPRGRWIANNGHQVSSASASTCSSVTHAEKRSKNSGGLKWCRHETALFAASAGPSPTQG